jgi:hypothetical protein
MIEKKYYKGQTILVRCDTESPLDLAAADVKKILYEKPETGETGEYTDPIVLADNRLEKEIPAVDNDEIGKWKFQAYVEFAGTPRKIYKGGIATITVLEPINIIP